MNIWQWIALALGSTIVYIVIGRIFFTLWSIWSKGENHNDPAFGVFWPITLLILTILLVLYAGLLVGRFVVFIFTKILFPAADWLGKLAARGLEKLK